MRFDQFALDDRLLAALTALDYQTPTPVQAEAIPALLDGRDVMAGAQTGTGKTAAFLLPMLQRLLTTPANKQPRALVLAPTRELAQQVASNARQLAANTELKITAVYGGTNLGPQIDLVKPGVDLLVATPGRLLDLIGKRVISLKQVAMVVFDEADRILDLGFKEEIRQVRSQLPKQRQTALFSATFDDSMFEFSKRVLTEPLRLQLNERNSTAAKIEQKLYVIDAERKAEFVAHLIAKQQWPQLIAFTRTKIGADELASALCANGINAASIHGDKTQSARDKVLAEFKQGQLCALIATDVAARGIDIQGLDVVINYDLPYIAEDYVHRIGRCGRAGREGLALSLLCPGEEYLLEEIEAVIGDRLGQQWYPGFEPDLTKEPLDDPRNSRAAQKRRAKKRGRGGRTGNRRG
ncbi:DEAD/DEAH box helicase [Ferrimonas senticii]|uniref:DEAD/DEAH box helicase n=1 Tax=Ferrimonas senticii TaxID=394566 RepID=UPI000426B6BF|nr:DEAD/DEAH box helicase [Ferrimonas senticii]